jgi:hypothetical protein
MHLTYMCAPHFYHAILSQPVVTLRLFNAQFLLSKYVTYFFFASARPIPLFLTFTLSCEYCSFLSYTNSFFFFWKIGPTFIFILHFLSFLVDVIVPFSLNPLC